MKNIYLDYASTAPLCTAAREAAISSMDNFGNPSSMHNVGLLAEKEVSAAREMVASAINAKPSEIHFTAGGTEANNLAIFGGAKLPNGTGIITSPTEHSSVKYPFLTLGQRGFKMFHVEHFWHGGINPDSLRNVLKQTSPVSLISFHHVQNETGVVQDIAALAKIVRDICPTALVHVDAVQSFCKIAIDVRAMDVDFISLSAHKIGGLKGCGALYVRDKVHVAPLILGGGQERGVRSGTENVIGIAAFGAATKERYEKLQENYSCVQRLKELFLSEIDGIDGIKINGENTSPYILNISVADVRPEVLLNALSAEGVYISAGAACSSNKKQKKEEAAVLEAYGLSKERSQSAVRISFSPETTQEEIKEAAEAFIRNIAILRKLRKMR
ncbi:MAG: cysteine desulfurase [Defluviitaleaceae bacterium]|nr:cysteine desulfurase [Defluviitaleaceae bacterium]